MSEDNRDSQKENEEACAILKRALRNLVGQGIIRSRDDLIRILSEENFEITDVTAQSITLCAPDEPENRVTLDGWLFSAGFSLSVPADGPGSEFYAGTVPHRGHESLVSVSAGAGGRYCADSPPRQGAQPGVVETVQPGVQVAL